MVMVIIVYMVLSTMNELLSIHSARYKFYPGSIFVMKIIILTNR